MDSLCLPRIDTFRHLLLDTLTALREVSGEVRPHDANGQPGGLVLCDPQKPVIIVPDLHGRYFFLDALLNTPCSTLGIADYIAVSKITDSSTAQSIQQNVTFNTGMGRGALDTLTVRDALAAGTVTLLLLGDLFHSERRCVERWKQSYDAYLNGNAFSTTMKAEMAECLETVSILMTSICAYPNNVFCLKGNHENILNREGGGDYPFYKYAAESSMVYDFMLEWCGAELLLEYSEFEQLLPVFAVGGNFLASHAEPCRVFTREELIGAHNNGDVITGLTWTKNDEADPCAAGKMLSAFFPNNDRALYFGGHRSISETYNIRAGGSFVQIHNPDLQNVAVIRPGCDFLFDTDIRSIDERYTNWSTGKNR